MVYKYVYCRFTYIYHKKLTNNVGRSTYHTLILDEHYLEHVSHIAAFFEVSTTSQGTNRSTRKSQFLPESWGEWSNPRSGEWGGLMSFFLQEKDDSFKWIKQKCELYMFQLWKQKKKTAVSNLQIFFSTVYQSLSRWIFARLVRQLKFDGLYICILNRILICFL